jgi:ParB/RepB/Spo0J family partition protein
MEVKDIEMSKIVVSKQNARKDLSAGNEEANLDDLANSIKEKGLLSPITVVQKGDLYELIVGQRRYLACKKLGYQKIAAIIRDETDDTDYLAISLIENIHRSDMSPIDKARAYRSLFDKYNDYDRVSKETGVSTATIRKYVKLLDLAPQLQDRLSTSEGVVGIDAMSRLSSTFSSPEDQLKVFDTVKGFTGKMQTEIIKRSDGDISKVPELVERAMQGEFNVSMCHYGFCDHMSDKLKEKIGGLIEQGKSLDELLA